MSNANINRTRKAPLQLDQVSCGHANTSRLLQPLMCLLVMGLVPAFSQSPPFVIQGPQISLTPGCALALEGTYPRPLTTQCVSIAYPAGSSISQNRYVLVPRGNLEFDVPVSSTIAKLITGHVYTGFGVTVTVSGPNQNETISQTSSISFYDNRGNATLRIPVNVDWAESIVSFQIDVSEELCLPGTQKNGEPNCSGGDGTFTGPDLSSVANDGNWIGSHWPTALSPDSFVIVATPAAAFQLPIVPTTIVYGPLGNGPKAVSSYSITEITATNQQFSGAHDETHSVTDDDKTQLQAGVSLSIASPKAGPQDTKILCGQDSKCDVTAGFTFSHTWDKSTQKQDENAYGSSASVAFETQNQYTISIPPTPSQPSLDKLTASTQPFWADVILGVANAQYALWDYPAGPVIQPLGGAHIVEMPVRQLDSCANAPDALEPVSFSPAQWAPSAAFAQGAVILDSNNNIQVVTSPAGSSGTAPPAWNTTLGGTTTDGAITWTNEQMSFVSYWGSVAQDSLQYVGIGPWTAGTAYSPGSVVMGPASIEVATTGGISGASVPNWNIADEATTADGTVIWTNEQEHIVAGAGPPGSHQSIYHWLTSQNCKDYLSLDQFYVSGTQNATPIAYDALGSELSLTPANAVTYSNQLKTTGTFGASTSGKHTKQVTSIGTTSLGASIAGDLGLTFAEDVLGLVGNVSGTKTWTTTDSNTTVDSTTLMNATTITGQAMASTTIQDLGKEQSIPANVLLDSIFMGIAVQDTNLPPAQPPVQAEGAMNNRSSLPEQFRNLPVVPPGHSPAELREGGSGDAPVEYVQQTNYGFAMVISKPRSTPEIEDYLSKDRAAHAASHEQRVIPTPPALSPSR